MFGIAGGGGVGGGAFGIGGGSGGGGGGRSGGPMLPKKRPFCNAFTGMWPVTSLASPVQLETAHARNDAFAFVAD